MAASDLLGDCDGCYDAAMNADALKPEEREALLGQYEAYRKAVVQILDEMQKRVGARRCQLVWRDLGVDDRVLLQANRRLKQAVYDYILFADRRKGSTIFEGWHRDHLKKAARPWATFNAAVDALAQSRFSAFEIEQLHSGLGIHVRDDLTGERYFVVDRLMSENWEVGTQFGNRIAVLPGFAIFLTESIESAVTPGQEFTGRPLNAADQAKLQTVVIEMFRDA